MSVFFSYALKKTTGWMTLALLLLFGCRSEVKNPSLTMDSADIVHAMVQIATINGVLEVSDASLRDSLFQHYKTETEHLTRHKYEDIVYNLNVLETMPDSLILFQSQALDTLRKLQNKIVYNRDVDWTGQNRILPAWYILNPDYALENLLRLQMASK